MEKKVSKDILDAIRDLDFDAGLRIEDNLGYKAFITRSTNEYCINVINSEEVWLYADSAEEVYEKVRLYLKGEIDAWIY